DIAAGAPHWLPGCSRHCRWPSDHPIHRILPSLACRLPGRETFGREAATWRRSANGETPSLAGNLQGKRQRKKPKETWQLYCLANYGAKVQEVFYILIRYR